MTELHPLDHDGDGKKGGSLPKRTNAEIQAEKRALAARQAAKVAKEIVEIPIVKARVTKLGDGKISTGEHITGIGDVHYEKGEIFEGRQDILQALEDRGLCEIQ